MGQKLMQFADTFIKKSYFPAMHVTDVVEILIIAFLIYQIMIWIKNTKAWMLLKGILVLLVFVMLAAFFHMHTILWLVKNSVAVMATAAIVVFQPELRRALEKLGERKFLGPVISSREKARFSEKTLSGIVDACFSMGRVKTGALIVVEQAIRLTEYESTGIELDCIVSSQVLINIFEHNTPLHDGAIIVRNDRIVSATCYLPLSDNMGLSKDLGTRHRAAVGMSEVSDALIIVVSEETGQVSVAQGGSLSRDLTRDELYERLMMIQEKQSESSKLFSKWKGRMKNERKTEE